MSENQIVLEYPVIVDAQEYKILHMRRCKVRDRRAAMKISGTDADKEIWLMASLCEVPTEVIDELDEADYAKIQAMFGSFRESVVA